MTGNSKAPEAQNLLSVKTNIVEYGTASAEANRGKNDGERFNVRARLKYIFPALAIGVSHFISC